jgi:short-subunit dehydrogenase
MPAFATAYVTGASAGIGAAVARRLAARGTHVVLAARRAALLEELAAELRAAGGRAEVAPVDVGDADAARAEVARWDVALGVLDLVLANAGGGEARPAQELTWSDVLDVLRINALGACATLFAGLECMRPRGRGTLGAVSSLAAYRGFPTSGAYSASKACLSTFAETLQADLRCTGIRVVDIRPGFVRTAMTAANTGPMPFLMDVEPAAELIVRALERGQPLCAFPLPVWLAVGLAQALPHALWRRVATLVRI